MISEQETESIIKEGWMFKKGGRISNWKKRWIVVSGREVKYYVDQEKLKLKGIISLDDVLEVGKIGHETRSHTFALKTENRLYVFDAIDPDEMNIWLKLFKGLQPNTIEANATVPQSTVGSVQKAIVKVITNIKSKFNKEEPSPENSPRSSDSRSNTPTQVRQTETRNTNMDNQRNTTQRAHSGLRMTTVDRSTTIQGGLGRNIVPNSFQENNDWTPMKKWEGTHEKPAWAYDYNDTFPEELSLVLEQLVAVSQTFNEEWSNLTEWSRKITSGECTKGTILQNIKQGLGKIELLWTSYEQIIAKCQAWNRTSMITEMINKMYISIKSLVEGKSTGWFIQLSSNISDEAQFELTYKREKAPTTDKPAWSYQIDPKSSKEVIQSMESLQKAANSFNEGWVIAIEASRKIGRSSFASSELKSQIDLGFATIQSSWKDYDIALAGLEKWNTNSLYTLEIKQHVNSLKRLAESKRKEWMTLLDRYQQNVKNNFDFEQEFESSDAQPAWYFKYSLTTPVEISGGLSKLKLASTNFNTLYSNALSQYQSLSPSNVVEVKASVVNSFNQMESCWSEFELALDELSQWNPVHEVIGQIKQMMDSLKVLIENKKKEWIEKIDDPALLAPPVKEVPIIEEAPPVDMDAEVPQKEQLTDAKDLLETVMKAITEAEQYHDKPNEIIPNIHGMGSGSFKLCHVYKEAILMLRRTEEMEETSDDIRNQIHEVEKAVSQTHIDLCTKWAQHFVQSGNMALGFEYYIALNDVLPEECQKLDEHFQM